MKKLILIRHGDFVHGGGNHLTNLGRRQIRELVELLLAEHIDGAKIGLLSSIAQRAIESKAVVADVLGRRVFDQHHAEILYSDIDKPVQLALATSIILDWLDQVEVVIVVTHYEYVRDLPRFFGHAAVGVGSQAFPREAIAKGDAWVIDLETKSCTHVVSPANR